VLDMMSEDYVEPGRPDEPTLESKRPSLTIPKAPPRKQETPPDGMEVIPQVSEARRDRALEELISVGTVTPIVPVEELAAHTQRAALPATRLGLSTLMGLTRALVWQWEKELGWRDEHSLRAARLCRKVGRQAGLPGHALNALRLAALLHELGQPTSRHITALSLQGDEALQDRARRALRMLADLLESTRVPARVGELLEAQFEQPRGGGVPGLASGDDIPQESNILAVVDAYLDLMDNPDTSSGQCQDKDEALARLRAAGERQVLCPLTVELLHQVISASALRERILSELSTVLLVDPERSAHLGLVGALRHEKAEVRAVIDPARAVRVALRESVDLVICELDLKPLDGLELLRRLRADERTRELPVLLAVNSVGEEQLAEARELGILDVLFKPYSLEELLEQILPMLAVRRADSNDLRRVSGSLREIPLIDLVRDLTANNKSGRLSLRLARQQGELRLQEGRVVEASWAGLSGEEAFNEMLGLSEGDFALDPLSITRPPALGGGGGDLPEGS